MSASSSQSALGQLQARIGYTFLNLNFLVEAVTHASFANENPGTTSNERLECLGDSVLGLIVTEELYEKFQDDREAEMTEKRKLLVNQAACEKLANAIELGRCLRLGQGEQSVGPGTAVLADAFEALVGAIHLDSHRDLATVRGAVLKIYGSLSSFLEEARVANVHNADYKSQLQRLVQEYTHGSEVPIRYLQTDRSGPDHKPTFTVVVSVEDLPPTFCGQGKGRKLKEAEQEAAKDLLEKIRKRQERAHL